MGYFGKLEEKSLAVELRKKGFSYKQIREKVPVAKSTLSLWCRDIALTPQQVESLEKRKLEGSELGRIIGAKKQQETRIKKSKSLLFSGISDVGKLTKRERFVAGAALYLGDGDKGDKSIGFSNSNPKIIKFMMSWFREFCDVPKEKFRGSVWIHENSSEPGARKYWSRLTGIPLSQFSKSYIAENKTRSRKIRKKIHKYGVFAVRVHSVDKQRKIMGWMSGVLGEPLV